MFKKILLNKLFYFFIALVSVVLTLLYLVTTFIYTDILTIHPDLSPSNFFTLYTNANDITKGVKDVLIAYFFVGGNSSDLKEYKNNEYNYFLDYKYNLFSPKNAYTIDSTIRDTYLMKRMTSSKMSRIEKYLNYCTSTFQMNFSEKEKCLWVHYAYIYHTKKTSLDKSTSPFQGTYYLLILDDITKQLVALNGKIATEESRKSTIQKIENEIIIKYQLKSTPLLTYQNNQLTYQSFSYQTNLKDLMDMLLETASMY